MEQARLRPSGKDIASRIERFSPNKQLFRQKFTIELKKMFPLFLDDFPKIPFLKDVSSGPFPELCGVFS
jgi:hypothetical protein